MDYLAWATDDELRRNGSSGGFIRSMVLYLLSVGEIDEMILTRTGPEEGPFHPGCLATTDRQEIASRRSSSVYYPTDPFAVQLDSCLRYAVTLLPCQVEELRKKQARGEWLNVAYVFELLCNHVPSAAWTSKLCESAEISDPRRVVYRGDGWPGKVTIDDDHHVLFLRAWPRDVRDFGLAKCQKCCRIYGASDWVCADPWGLSSTMVGEGKTLVRTVTSMARRLFSDAIRAGQIQGSSDEGLLQRRLKNHRRRK